MRMWSRTDLGRTRANNEDYCAVDEELGIAVLADGMGGMNAGEVASARAVEIVMQRLAEALRPGPGARSGRDIVGLLSSAFSEANRDVHELSTSHPEYLGMGTTLVAAVAEPGMVVTAHVGDSRAYAYQAGELRRITSDHSLVNELVLQGVLSAEEARQSPNRNIITRAIGIEPHVRCDVNRVPMDRGDLLLLCTDGLTDMLTDEEIAAGCARWLKEPERLLEALIDQANASGGFDNVSTVLVAW